MMNLMQSLILDDADVTIIDNPPSSPEAAAVERILRSCQQDDFFSWRPLAYFSTTRNPK